MTRDTRGQSGTGRGLESGEGEARDVLSPRPVTLLRYDGDRRETSPRLMFLSQVTGRTSDGTRTGRLGPVQDTYFLDPEETSGEVRVTKCTLVHTKDSLDLVCDRTIAVRRRTDLRRFRRGHPGSLSSPTPVPSSRPPLRPWKVRGEEHVDETPCDSEG